jgi:hypothetical protein
MGEKNGRKEWEKRMGEKNGRKEWEKLASFPRRLKAVIAA